MATITLRALPGHHEQEPGYASMATVIEVLGTCLGQTRAEAKTLDQVRALVKTFGGGVAAEHPDKSFMVSVGVAKGSRKPTGFDAANQRDGLGELAWMKTVTKANRGNPGLAA
jgi:hypothetical protein